MSDTTAVYKTGPQDDSQPTRVRPDGQFSTSLADTKIKLSPWRKFAYALADGGNNFSYSFIISFLLFFATDVFGVGAAIIGAVILFSRLLDAVLDPFIGGLADQTRTRWGSYRPWILFGSIPLCVLLVLCFTAWPIESVTVKTIYISIVFVLSIIAYSCVNIPYSAATAVITRDADERASVTSWRLVVAVSVGTFFIGQATLPLVEFFGQGDARRGWFLTALTYACIAMVLYVISFLNIKEVLAPHAEKQTFRQMFDAMKGNGPAWILSIGFLVLGVYWYGRSSSYLYYFTYVAGDQSMYTQFMLWFAVGSLAGAISVPIIGPHLKNKGTLPTVGFFVIGVLMIIMQFVDPSTNFVLVVVVNMVIAFFGISAMTMMYGMVPDTTEYGEWKTGIRAAGFISAFITFALKVGMALGISAIGFILGGLGYVAGEAQSPAVLTAINSLTNIIPGIFALVGGVVFLFYKLDKKTYDNILEEVSSRTYDVTSGNRTN